ncbi:hypothetical protein [Methyloversatilis sp.]|uniref:hypothetical protein n=1 Tax=Methyloversatilis sp. TaxID=2569862 RepID=UPI0035B1C412
MTEVTSVSEIKSFEVSSGNLRVTDPCYKMDVWCAGTLDKVPNGMWHSRVGFWKDEAEVKQRIDWLREHHEKMLGLYTTESTIAYENESFARELERIESHPGRVIHLRIAFDAADLEKPLNLSTMINSDIDVGVDSGQAGFFDLNAYAELFTYMIDGEPAHDDFYDRVCEATNPFGVCTFGVASLTGYGDGGYDCYTRRDDEGNLLEAVIVFIGDEEDDDDEEEDE